MQNKDKPRNWVPLTISIPKQMLKQLDVFRGDITRSRYLQRIFQDHVKVMEISD